MTRSEIMTLADLLTEQKGKPLQPSYPIIFAFVVRDICKRGRFWWKKSSVTFSTVVGTTKYDLTTIATTPALTEISVEEVTRLQINVSNAWVPLTAIYDDSAVQDMLLTTTKVQPGRYTFAPGDYKTLLIDPPDAVYTARMTFWAMPNPSTDSSTETVPLIPPWSHGAIVEGVAAYIWESLYGLRDAKTVDFKRRYEESIMQLEARPSFGVDYVQTLISGDAAIRST